MLDEMDYLDQQDRQRIFDQLGKAALDVGLSVDSLIEMLDSGMSGKQVVQRVMDLYNRAK